MMNNMKTYLRNLSHKCPNISAMRSDEIAHDCELTDDNPKTDISSTGSYSLNLYSEVFEQSMNMRNFDPRTQQRRQLSLIIFSEISTLRLNCSFTSKRKVLQISSAYTELLDRRISFIRLLGNKYPTFCVMDINSANCDRQQASQHICNDVSFLPVAFPSIYSASFAGCYHFYTMGINNCVSWTFFASDICSRLFTKYSKILSISLLFGCSDKAMYC